MASPIGSPRILPINRFYQINCSLFGDYDPNHVFTIRTIATENADGLKERIKLIVNPFYQGLPPYQFKLWKVDIPVNKAFKDAIKDFKPVEDQMLMPTDTISSVFPEEPQVDMLHIIAKPPSLTAIVSGHCPEFQSFKVNIAVGHCSNSIDPNNIITFPFARESTFTTLKYAIKETVKPLFDKVPYPLLRIWIANIPINKDLGKALGELALEEGETMFMNSGKTLEEMFPEGMGTEKLHFVVKAPICYCTKQSSIDS